jgi:hypothetical protein
MIPLQQRRHEKLSRQIVQLGIARDAAITRLVRLETRLRVLLKARARYERLLAEPEKSKTEKPKALPLPPPPPPIVEERIPDFLKRSAPLFEGNKDYSPLPKTLLDEDRALKDEEAKAQLLKEQEDKKHAKARANAEKRKARKRGDLKKMPLSGKDALKMIWDEKQ